MVTDEKNSRIRSRQSEVRICGSGSVAKCHESATLLDNFHNYWIRIRIPMRTLSETEIKLDSDQNSDII
jgi:hypothetical protein